MERSGAQSVLGARRHVGPLRVQRPFYPEGRAVPHVYVLHPPGGMVGDDRLEIAVRLRRGASALLTTPAAQKLYRSAGAVSRQHTELSAEEDAALEWLPSETIVFDGARAEATTHVALARGASLLAWDIVCFGRTASELPFQRGNVAFRFQIAREGVPIAVERVAVTGGSAVLDSVWGYRSLPVYGTLYCVPGDPDTLRELGETLASSDECFATVLDELLVVRAAGPSVEKVRAVLVRAWEQLRPRVLGRVPVAPRIWAV